MQNDVWELRVEGNVNTQQHIHTLHMIENEPLLNGAGLLTAYSGAPLTAYRGCFGTDMTPVLSITAQKVCGSVPLPSPDQSFPVGTARNGTRSKTTTQWQPSFLAALVTEKGEIAGRRYSGRFFMGGLYEDDTEYQNLSAAYVTALTGYCSALATAFITPGTNPWRLFAFSSLLAKGDPNHTKRNPVAGGPRLADPVTAVQCQAAGSLVRALVVSTNVTTMRSRKQGHGS